MSGTDYTQTPNYGLYKPLPNADINQWGSHLNLNADALDGLLHTNLAGAPFLPLAGGGAAAMSGHLFMANHSMLDVAGINSYNYAPLPFGNAIQTAGYQFWPPGGTITFSGAGQPFLDINANYAGTIASGALISANRIVASADGVQAPLNNSFAWLSVNGNVGAPATGGRVAIYGLLTAVSEAGDVAAGNPGGAPYVAVGGAIQINANQGGTNLTTGAAGGAYGANFLANLGPACTNYGSLIGTEISVGAATGSSVKNKIGIQIVQTSNDGVSATNGDDIGIFLANQSLQGTAPGWSAGLSFGSANAAFPIKSTGTIIRAGTSAGSINAASGIDFSAVTFATAFLKSTGFTVDGSGHVAPLLTNATNDAAAATAGVPVGAMYRNGNAVQVRLT